MTCFWIREITSKKYMEMTWKFVKIWSSTYRDVICTSNRRRFDVECPLGINFTNFLTQEQNKRRPKDVFIVKFQFSRRYFLKYLKLF